VEPIEPASPGIRLRLALTLQSETAVANQVKGKLNLFGKTLGALSVVKSTSSAPYMAGSRLLRAPNAKVGRSTCDHRNGSKQLILVPAKSGLRRNLNGDQISSAWDDLCGDRLLVHWFASLCRGSGRGAAAIAVVQFARTV